MPGRRWPRAAQGLWSRVLDRDMANRIARPSPFLRNHARRVPSHAAVLPPRDGAPPPLAGLPEEDEESAPCTPAARTLWTAASVPNDSNANGSPVWALTHPKMPHRSQENEALEVPGQAKRRPPSAKGDRHVDAVQTWQSDLDPLSLESTADRRRRSKWGSPSAKPIRSATLEDNPKTPSNALAGEGVDAKSAPLLVPAATVKSVGVLKEEAVLKFDRNQWPLQWQKRRIVLFSDWTIACFKDDAARLLGHECGMIKVTAASTACRMLENGRFEICESQNREKVWLFEAGTDDSRDDWVDRISNHVLDCALASASDHHDMTRRSSTNPDGDRESYCVDRAASGSLKRREITEPRVSSPVIVTRSLTDTNPMKDREQSSVWSWRENNGCSAFSKIQPKGKETMDVHDEFCRTGHPLTKEPDVGSTRKELSFSGASGTLTLSEGREVYTPGQMDLLSPRALRQRILKSADALAALLAPTASSVDATKDTECVEVSGKLANDIAKSTGTHKENKGANFERGSLTAKGAKNRKTGQGHNEASSPSNDCEKSREMVYNQARGQTNDDGEDGYHGPVSFESGANDTKHIRNLGELANINEQQTQSNVRSEQEPSEIQVEREAAEARPPKRPPPPPPDSRKSCFPDAQPHGSSREEEQRPRRASHRRAAFDAEGSASNPNIHTRVTFNVPRTEEISNNLDHVSHDGCGAPQSGSFLEPGFSYDKFLKDYEVKLRRIAGRGDVARDIGLSRRHAPTLHTPKQMSTYSARSAVPSSPFLSSKNAVTLLDGKQSRSIFSPSPPFEGSKGPQDHGRLRAYSRPERTVSSQKLGVTDDCNSPVEGSCLAACFPVSKGCFGAMKSAFSRPAISVNDIAKRPAVHSAMLETGQDQVEDEEVTDGLTAWDTEGLLVHLVAFLRHNGGRATPASMDEFYNIHSKFCPQEAVSKVGGLRSLCGRKKELLLYRNRIVFLRDMLSGKPATLRSNAKATLVVPPSSGYHTPAKGVVEDSEEPSPSHAPLTDLHGSHRCNSVPVDDEMGLVPAQQKETLLPSGQATSACDAECDSTHDGLIPQDSSDCNHSSTGGFNGSLLSGTYESTTPPPVVLSAQSLSPKLPNNVLNTVPQSNSVFRLSARPSIPSRQQNTATDDIKSERNLRRTPLESNTSASIPQMSPSARGTTPGALVMSMRPWIDKQGLVLSPRPQTVLALHKSRKRELKRQRESEASSRKGQELENSQSNQDPLRSGSLPEQPAEGSTPWDVKLKKAGSQDEGGSVSSPPASGPVPGPVASTPTVADGAGSWT